MKHILKGARARIAQGWTQKRYMQGHCFCLAGAINHALGSSNGAYLGLEGDEFELVDQILNYLYELSEEVNGTMNFITWNDEPGRTQEEVLAFLDLAIERAP